MQPGDLLLFRGTVRDPIDLAIMLCTGSRFVHVGVAVGEGEFVEAVPPAVRRVPLAGIAGRDTLIVAPAYPDEAAREAAIAAALAQLGKGYDRLGLLLLALYLHLPRGRRLALAALTRLPWHRGRVICSEVAALALAAGRLAGTLRAPAPVTYPGECAAACGRDEAA